MRDPRRGVSPICHHWSKNSKGTSSRAGEKRKRTSSPGAVFGLKLRLLELLCFLKIHGIVGFERWVAGKLPPALLALWAMRRRTHRFYRESIRRQNNQRHRAR